LQAEYVNKTGTDVFFINVNNLILHIIDTVDLPKLQWKITTVSQLPELWMLAVSVRSDVVVRWCVDVFHELADAMSGTCGQLLPFCITGTDSG